jgi:ferrous iron transport protein A
MKNRSLQPRSLADLKLGEKAVIESFTDKELALKLLEMGCLPGETVELMHIAPLGDPIAIHVSGYTLALRRSEASSVIIRDMK